ncbi:MAG: DUF4272 domain-containing protein [Chloroflexi bacterium]|nr:DUF4272 domain-containing protein [Chloroflexota bacterium]
MSQLRLQDSRAVAYRALSLGALLKRGEWELTVQNLDERLIFDDVREHVVHKHNHLNDQLGHWLEREKINHYLSQSEQHLLKKPLGTWSERTLISVGWRIEALGVMLWALNRIDSIPAYDTQFEAEQVLAPLDLGKSTIDLIWLASLRTADELRHARDGAELWNWRSRATELERLGVRPPDGVKFSDVIRATAERGFASGQLPRLMDGDFAVFGKAYVDLTEDEFALTSAIAYERYFALNWICELSSEWESIRIDL